MGEGTGVAGGRCKVQPIVVGREVRRHNGLPDVGRVPGCRGALGSPRAGGVGGSGGPPPLAIFSAWAAGVGLNGRTDERTPGDRLGSWGPRRRRAPGSAPLRRRGVLSELQGAAMADKAGWSRPRCRRCGRFVRRPRRCGRQRLYCGGDRRCRDRSLARGPVRVRCEACGARLVCQRKRRRWCGPRCRHLADRTVARRGSCSECGAEFRRGCGTPLTCGPVCGVAREKRLRVLRRQVRRRMAGVSRSGPAT